MGGKNGVEDLRVTQSSKEKTEDEVCAERGASSLEGRAKVG